MLLGGCIFGIAIADQARKLGIFTYELRYDSPAFKLFMCDLRDDSFNELLLWERVALAEFLVYLLHLNLSQLDCDEELWELIKVIEPLDLDVSELKIYFDDIGKGHVPIWLYDAVTYLYEEMKNSKERISLMDAISSYY